MIKLPAYKGSIAIYGLGVSGLAAMRALLASGTKVLAWDDDADRRAEAEKCGGEIYDLSTLPDNLPDDVEALLLSPGIALTHSIPTRAREAGVPIIGDMTLFARALAASTQAHSAPVICITGTNGKSTTTALTAHLLKACGFHVQMGGNIGHPVMALDMPDEKTIYVIELSSYQMDLSPDFSADIAVLLNITPDHIDRHGSFENYAQAKYRLIENLTAKGAAIIGIDCDTARQAMSKSSAKVHTISGHDAQADCFVKQGVLHDEQGAVVDLSAIRTLQGRHNGQNAAAAYMAARLVGAERDALAGQFETFAGLAHRMQMVAEYHNVLFVNDSKATNAEATAQALTSFKNIYWIAGGVPKTEGAKPLLPFLSDIRKAYLIGQAAESFAAVLAEHIPVDRHETLQAATHAAAQEAVAAEAEKGGVVLFSPACASFDLFKDFEQRGDAFCAAVADFTSAHQIGGAA